MNYTNEELNRLTYEELCNLTIDNMVENPPTRGLGFNHIVLYACKFCGKRLEGSERRVSKNTNKDVRCPYCGNVLWSAEDTNALRRTAFMPGHFEEERKKSYLKFLKDNAKRRELKKCK